MAFSVIFDSFFYVLLFLGLCFSISLLLVNNLWLWTTYGGERLMVEFHCRSTIQWIKLDSGALRTRSVAFEAKIWINFMPNEEAWHNCLLLLRVAPPLMFTVMSFQAIPINSLAVPSPSLRVYQCNKLDMRTFCKQNFTIVSAPLRSISAGSTFYPWE